MARRKRLLVALDGSERAVETVRYAGQEKAFRGAKLVLYHVFNSIPDAYYDLEREPKSVKVVKHVRSWEAQQKKNMQAFMENARRMLIDAGHADTAVDVKIQHRKKGVARDIIIEAHQGYDAILLRRRGATALKNIIVGSVTSKLLEKLTFIPVLVAGRKPINRKFIIAVDGSECAHRAVAFVAEMIGGLDGYLVRLVHVVRGGSPDNEKIVSENGLGDSSSIFHQAVSILSNAGIAPENISTKTIGGVLSRAGAIVGAAEKGDWGTIVVGRRGWSSVSDFFIGRVSNKVVHAGRKDTVWIVT
jgi:nucleotide-binding universal stress UspA family protein